MTDLTRRQIGVKALSVLAAAAMPAPITRLLHTSEADDSFSVQQAEWISEIASLAADFRWASCNYFVDQNARQEWWLCHHDLASDTDMLRKDALGCAQRKRLICDWLDSLYPSPAVRALRAPSALRDLTPAFAEHQAELDDITAQLGEAEHRIGRFKQNRPRFSHYDPRYLELHRTADRLVRRQHQIAGSFVFLEVVTRNDFAALSQAASTHHGCKRVCKLNARRRYLQRRDPSLASLR